MELGHKDTSVHVCFFVVGCCSFDCRLLFSVCLINLHRTCVKLYDDTCPGPINKSKGFKILRIMQHESSDNRRKHSSQCRFYQFETRLFKNFFLQKQEFLLSFLYLAHYTEEFENFLNIACKTRSNKNQTNLV